MEKPEFFVTPGYGEGQLNGLHYSQAVKIGNRVETSGQGGWNHVGFPPEVNEVMVKLYRHYMPNHAPIWTSLGVAALGDPTMRVEIRVTAIVP